MARVIATFFSFVLLTASSLLASNVEETYQAALTQEKGEGNLEEAIRLYQQVIEAHEKRRGRREHGGPGRSYASGYAKRSWGWHRRARPMKLSATSTPTSHRWKWKRNNA